MSETKQHNQREEDSSMLSMRAVHLLSLYEKFLRFLFLCKIPFDPVETIRPWKEVVTDHVSSLLQRIKRCYEKKEDGDPYEWIMKLFQTLMSWEILYRRFKYGIRFSDFGLPETQQNRKKFLGKLYIVPKNNNFFRIDAAVNDSSLLVKELSAKTGLDVDFNNFFHLISEEGIEEACFRNKKVSYITMIFDCLSFYYYYLLL